VTVAGPGRPVRLTVADTGQGIPAGLLAHVFDRFRSGDASAGSTAGSGADSASPRGTGLGLALVRAVARAHGGDVMVHSEPGQGSEFELLLPAPSGPSATGFSPAGGKAAGAEPAGGRLARKP
jgi:signal transduction histidine kinase